MEHKTSKEYLDNLITRQQGCTSETSEHTRKQSRKKMPKAWVIRIFSKLQVIYSHKWTANIDTDELYQLALEEWSGRLAGLRGDDIAMGLSKLESKWPPTPMEFKLLCEQDQVVKHLGYQARKEFEQGHTDNERREARRAIRAMRKILNK